ncbi:MAG: hypothetical protein IRY83_14820 [Chloroflexi bacterium]|nr:hypothetical protein [Chloroflexota bacterium]
MAQRLRQMGTGLTHRMKMPLNPGVRGTGKQSRREDKGTAWASLHRGEGTGHPPGHGRGGKTTRQRVAHQT